MTTKADAQKNRATKKRAPSARAKRNPSDAQRANGGLTGKQALALWALVLKGDGQMASKQPIKIEKADLEALERAHLISIEPGPRKKDPWYGAKIHVTDEGWSWANRQGLGAAFARTTSAATLLELLLEKIGKYLEVQGLALDHLLRPRQVEAATPQGAATERDRQAPALQDAGAADLEQRIRAAYLQVTGGVLNEFIRLALLRAKLGGAPAEAVDAELREMQQRGGAVLYPIDDPQRIRPEDEAAVLRIAGERRDLFCITR